MLSPSLAAARSQRLSTASPAGAGRPSQNEQVRSFTDVDVMMHIGVEQPRYDGKFCQRQPHIVACSLLKGL